MNILFIKPIIVNSDFFDHIVVSSCILNSNFLIKQIIKKDKTIINDNFIKSLKIVLNTKFYFDFVMLDKIKNIVNDNLTQLNNNKVNLIGNYSDDDCDNNNDLNDFFLKFNLDVKKKIKNLENENKLLFREKINTIINDPNIDLIILNIVNKIIKKYNKINKTNLKGLNKIIDLESFLKQNWFVFVKKESNLDTTKIIDKLKFESAIVLFKKNNKNQTNLLFKEILNLKSKSSYFDSLQSLSVRINYFKEVSDLIKNINDNVYFLIFCDFRGRVYYNSQISIQSH